MKISEFEKKFSEFESSEEADQNDDKFEELYLDVEEASKDYSDYLSELKKSVDEYEILIKQVEECTEKLTSKNEYDINSNNKNRERIKIINKKLEMFENQ